FSKLDTALRARFRAFVFEEVRKRALPALLATHDYADAKAAGGRVIVLEPPSIP
ncbi:MAG: ABC transporter ATP-binding protein, partial [Hyphomicrobiales bacterium]|nr:ABC transporter ATP-binding protein [Hyphomicrobiales bacterium]